MKPTARHDTIYVSRCPPLRRVHVFWILLRLFIVYNSLKQIKPVAWYDTAFFQGAFYSVPVPYVFYFLIPPIQPCYIILYQHGVRIFYYLMHLRFQTLSHLRLQYHLTDKWSSSLTAILCACGHFDIIHNFNGVGLCLSSNSVPHICRASFHFLFSFHGYSFFFRVSSASNPMSRYPSRVLFLFSMFY